MRYEAAIDTPLGFSPSVGSFSRLSNVTIEFEQHRFIWHDGHRDSEQHYWPVVTLVAPSDDVNAAAIVNRFLSALCFVSNLPMSVAAMAGTGFKAEFDPPIIAQSGYGASVLLPPMRRLEVEDDDRLRLTLALYREGRSATSPFYRYLAFYNALDAAFDNNEPARDAFIRAGLDRTEPSLSDGEEQKFDWADYLRDSLRNAVAHAVRYPGKPVLNPDESKDRSELADVAEHTSNLVRHRVEERWPRGVRDW